MSRATYRHSSFLDSRIWRTDAEEREVALEDFLSQKWNESPKQVVHFVQHQAFCCSTLLTRYLDLVPSSFVLREPSLLTQLAGLSKEPEFENLLTIALRLLSRTYTAGDFVVLKPSDACNAIMPALLGLDSRSRVVCLTIPLREFITAVLKDPGRRQWLRSRLRDGCRDAAPYPELAGVDVSGLRDAEGAAYLWLLNERLRQELYQRDRNEIEGSTSRILCLEGSRLADSPLQALRSVAAHFGVSLNEQQFIGMTGHASVRQHAKNPGAAYDPDLRKRDAGRQEALFGEEAASGIAWAGAFGYEAVLQS